MCNNLLEEILSVSNFNSVIRNIEKYRRRISYQSAIELWLKGYDIYCYVESHGYTYSFKGERSILIDNFYETGVTKDMFNQGIWYTDN